MSKSADDYTLKIKIGPDYDTSKMQTVHVNDELHPFYLDTPYFEGYFVIRVLNFQGLTPSSNQPRIDNPSSNYFKGRNRRYSIMFQGKFKQEWNGDDLLFGAEFDSPIRLPTGWQFALKIAQWLDPNMVAHLDADKPSIFSPLLCAMNAMAVYDAQNLQSGLPPIVLSEKEAKKAAAIKSKKKCDSQGQQNHDDDDENSSQQKLDSTIDQAITTAAPTPEHIQKLGKWSFHSDLITENISNIPKLTDVSSSPISIPELPTYEKRKKYFSDPNKRKQVKITPDHIYCMDFYDAYIDFNTVSLKLPGLSLNAFRYWDGQPLRFTIKSRDGKILFTVVFELVEKSTVSSS